MQTIIILLDPGKLKNPDLDLRYFIPDRMEEITGKAVQDNGYDYVDAGEGQPGPLLGIWLKTEDAEANWPKIYRLFREEFFLDNDLSLSAEIYLSSEENASLENCTRVYPADIPPKERELLSCIRKRPPMFIGEYSLSKLHCFFEGYKLALHAHSMEPYDIIPVGFREFVLKKYRLSGSMGYVRAILRQTPDGKEAVETFFELLDEFLEANRFSKIL